MQQLVNEFNNYRTKMNELIGLVSEGCRILGRTTIALKFLSTLN